LLELYTVTVSHPW